ncbi:nuclear transport factor 2 family protein [Arthrobacter sp. SA17]
MTEKDPLVSDPLTCVLGFIRTLEGGGRADDIRPFLADGFVLVEAPHVLAPKGSTKTLEDVLAGAENSGEVVTGQRFEVNRTTCEGGRVVIEADWSATLRMDLPYWDSGEIIRARTTSVFEVSGGRILSQDSYDCYFTGG